MNRHISWAFLAVSVAFFLFIVGLTGYRLENARAQNSLLARDRLIDITAKVASIRTTYVSLDSPAARKELRGLFDGEPRLLLMSVHSPNDGILYLVSRNSQYLKEPAAPTAQWRGTPAYQVSKGYEVVLSRPLDGNAAGAVLDAVFVIMGREDLYPIVRDDLYLFLAFLLVGGVVILIVVSVQGVPSEAERPVRGPADPHGMTSPRSGLYRAEHFEAKLHAELERVTALGQDLALARIRIDEPFADSHLPAVYTEIARVLLLRFPAHECLFESGNDLFTALLPEVDIDAAVRSLDAFRKAVGSRQIEGKARALSIGVSSRGGRLLSASTLLEEADISLSKASREGGSQVVGFRADPSRYRAGVTA